MQLPWAAQLQILHCQRWLLYFHGQAKSGAAASAMYLKLYQVPSPDNVSSTALACQASCMWTSGENSFPFLLSSCLSSFPPFLFHTVLFVWGHSQRRSLEETHSRSFCFSAKVIECTCPQRPIAKHQAYDLTTSSHAPQGGGQRCTDVTHRQLWDLLPLSYALRQIRLLATWLPLLGLYPPVFSVWYALHTNICALEPWRRFRLIPIHSTFLTRSIYLQYFYHD